MIGVKIHLESLVPRGLLGVEELGIGQRILTVEPDSEYPSPGIGGSSAELVNTRQDDAMGIETFINVIGFSAGLLVAASLLPQIWRAHKRESAEDLSFFWQGTVAVGVSLQLIYLYHYGMWAVFYPLFSELTFIVYLAGLKLYYEHHLLGLGRGGDRSFVKKAAGLSSNDDYAVFGGGAGDGIGRGAAVAGGEGSGGDTPTSDPTGQELEGAEKGRLANVGGEGASQSTAL
eukprot:g7664.t1